MKPEEFKKELERLSSAYGSKAYPQVRADLLWAEFKSVEAQVFTDTISRLIGENTMPPMMPKFREALSEIRDRSWAYEKKQNAEDARSFGTLCKAADQSVSFTEYVRRAFKRNEKEEMQSLIKVFGLPKIEEILEGKAS